jgi:hypothetical protein
MTNAQYSESDNFEKELSLFLKKGVQYAPPEKPDKFCYILGLVFCGILLQKSHATLSDASLGVFGIAVFVLLNLRQERIYTIASLKWQLANAIGLLKYFSQNKKKGAPWFHSLAIPEDANGRKFDKTSEDGIRNGLITCRRLERKIELMANDWWRISEPISLDEKQAMERLYLEERQKQQRVKLLKPGQKIIAKDNDIELRGVITSVEKTGRGFSVKWNGIETAEFITYVEIDDFIFEDPKEN